MISSGRAICSTVVDDPNKELFYLRRLATHYGDAKHQTGFLLNNEASLALCGPGFRGILFFPSTRRRCRC